MKINGTFLIELPHYVNDKQQSDFCLKNLVFLRSSGLMSYVSNAVQKC